MLSSLDGAGAKPDARMCCSARLRLYLLLASLVLFVGLRLMVVVLSDNK